MGRLRCAVDAVVAEAPGIVWARGDFEVVDLLERRLDRRLLVVLVRRIARPVAARGDHLAGDQRVGVENACGAEVVHLAAAVAGAAQLDGNVGGRHPAVGQLSLGAGAADRESSFAAERVALAGAEVDHVGGAVEHRRARRQFERLVAAVDGATAGQRQDHHFGVAGLQCQFLHRLQLHHLQAGLGPAGRFGCDVDGVGEGRAARRDVVLAVHSSPSLARPPHHRHGGRDRRADVVVCGIEQRPADDEAAHRRQGQCLLPARERLVRIGGIAAEQQGRQRGRLHDAVHLVDDRQLHPGVGGRGTQALADVHRLDHRVGAQVVADLAVHPCRHERLEHRDQPVGGELVDGPGARLQRRYRARIAEVDAAQHLSAVHPRRGGGGRGGSRHPVVEFELCACQAAAVHRREHHLVLERAEQQQVVEDVGGRQHPVHARIGQRCAQPVEQIGAAVHGGRADLRHRGHRAPGGRRRRSSACRCRELPDGWCASARRARWPAGRPRAHR